MVAITNPSTKVTALSGEYKLLALNDLTIAASSDALTLSFTENGVSEIAAVVGTPSAGLDNAFSYIETSFTGLIVIVKSFAQAGGGASDFTGTKVNLLLVVK